jgi:membrane fusion protein, type I secretion system
MTQKNSGKVGYSSFLPLLVGFGTFVLLIGGFSAWTMKAEIDGAVVASGQIVVDRNRHAIQHLTGGIIENVFVKEGDKVNEGDLLVTLDPAQTQSELTIVEGQLYELMARRGRLEAERDETDAITFDPMLLEQAAKESNVQLLMEGQIRLFDIRRENLDKSVIQLRNQKQQLQEQIGGIDAQMVALERQLKLIGTEIEMQEALLEKGLSPQTRLLALQRTDARLAGSNGELTARGAQAMERISELNIQELQLHSRRREESISVLRDLQFNEMEMGERRRALITQLERMQIRAPVSGVVYDLRLFGARSVVRAADPLLYIVPQDRSLVIAARVDPLDVNRVFVDQEVVLRFPAFDMRSTPDLFGRVTRISPDSFSDPQSGRAYFRTEIVLPRSEFSKLSEGQELIPGMPAETFIRTGEYTPLTYLTRPLTRYFQKAMRDEG